MHSVFLNKAKFFFTSKNGQIRKVQYYVRLYCIPSKETMILCGRGAQTSHIKNIAVFFHPMEQIEVVSGKFNMVTMEAEFTRLVSELSFLQVRATMTLQETIRQVMAEICEDRKQIAHTRLESIRVGESLQSHAGVRERTSGQPQWGDGVRDQVSGDGGAPKDPRQVHQ